VLKERLEPHHLKGFQMHSGPASTTSPPKSTTRIAISNSNHKRRADIFKHPLLVEAI
jgi:hypothetical protein